MLRTVEASVLHDVRKAELLVVFENRAGVDDQP
jgi:hypothetical protein